MSLPTETPIDQVELVQDQIDVLNLKPKLEEQPASDSDDITVVDGNGCHSDCETDTESVPQCKARRNTIESEVSNTGAQKGLLDTQLEYLAAQHDKQSDNMWNDSWEISDTFFRDHGSGVSPPERWIAVQEYLEAQVGKETNCGNYLKKFLEKVPVIEAEASRLRNGVPCRLDLKHFNRGSYNIVFKILFDDEVKWAMRILVPEISLKPKERAEHQDTQLKALYSQLGSMKYVKQNTTIPCPEIYGHDFSETNVAAAPYMFMELVEGMSIKKWLDENVLTKEIATEFYKNLADLMWEFYRTRFDQIGSLQFDELGNVSVSPFFDARTRSTFGPFTSAHDFLTHRQQKLWEYRVLAEHRNTQVIPPGIKRWDDLQRDVKQIFIAWLYREAAKYAQAEYTAGYNDVLAERVHMPDFVLFHADLSINNILVDEDLNILAVIDWDWTASLPKAAFDPLPFDIGYDADGQFPGPSNGPKPHEVFDHKELFYPFWKALEQKRDPEGYLGRSLVPARLGESSIATILNWYAWTYCIDRTNVAMLNKLSKYEGHDSCWGCLIERFRSDWTLARKSNPTWLDNLLTSIGIRRRR